MLLRLLVCAGAIIAAHLLDGWAYEHLQVTGLAETDLGRMLRVLGFLPLWLVIAVSIALSEKPGPHGRLRRGGLLMASATIGGLLAELVKILVRRERPIASGGYRFRPWDVETLNTGGLGLPSSHALVAFAGFAMLACLYPRARLLWWTLGAGCAFSRLAAGAHFLSDVVVSAVLGYFVATILIRALGAPRPSPRHVVGSK